MRTQFDTFYGAAGTYAKLLGERGLATYRRRAEAAWARVPQTRPGEKDPEGYGRTFRIKHIMETLARLNPATLKRWSPSKHATYPTPRPFSRLQKSTAKHGRPTRRWTGPNAGSKRSPTGPIHVSANFWLTSTIAASATTKR